MGSRSFGIVNRRRRALAALGFALYASMAHGAHPLLTEDANTQGAGRFELEIGTASVREDNGRAFELNPQLAYGILDNLDAIVRPSWFALSGDAIGESGRRRGFGDTVLDLKWRFATIEPTSFAIRAGLDLPTAANGIPGFDGTGWHALLIATSDLSALTLTGDVGYLHTPRQPGLRRDIYRVSAAAIYEVHERVQLLINAEMRSSLDADRGTWPAALLVGAIVTVTPWLDLDAGWQRRLNNAGPRQVFYAGATIRW